MKALFASATFAIAVLLVHPAHAAAPAGSTALCNDGSYYSGQSKRGACSGHKGIKEWYGAAAAPAAAPAAAAPAAPPAAAPAAAAAHAKQQPPTPAKDIAQKPGGGPGKVWVNAESKTYHCANDEWYGKTKQGQYMTVAQAEAAGAHAAHGKACAN